MAKVILVIDTPTNTVTVRPCDDAGTPTAPTQIINMGSSTVIESFYEQNQYFDYTRFNQWGASPVGTNPGEYPPMPNLLPLNPNWGVRIFNAGSPNETMDIRMSNIFGAPYANSSAGANAAIVAISAAIP